MLLDHFRQEIVHHGHQVTVYVPFYRQVQSHFPEKKVVIPSITIPFQYYNRFRRRYRWRKTR